MTPGGLILCEPAPLQVTEEVRSGVAFKDYLL